MAKYKFTLRHKDDKTIAGEFEMTCFQGVAMDMKNALENRFLVEVHYEVEVLKCEWRQVKW